MVYLARYVLRECADCVTHSFGVIAGARSIVKPSTGKGPASSVQEQHERRLRRCGSAICCAKGAHGAFKQGAAKLGIVQPPKPKSCFGLFCSRWLTHVACSRPTNLRAALPKVYCACWKFAASIAAPQVYVVRCARAEKL